MLRAYFDESGKLKDPNEKVSAVGGCISTAEEWCVFEQRWRKILKRFNVTQLHMNNLERQYW